MGWGEMTRPVENMKRVVIALGSNDRGAMPDIASVFEAASHELVKAGVRSIRLSRWWQSAAWPDPTDPPFLNGVATGEWAGSAEALMAVLSSVEAAYGRKRERRNAPRTLDLDLIDFDGQVREGPGLILPHPRAAERLFVMGPLAELWPDWRHPVSGLIAKDLAGQAAVGIDAMPVE